jgi:N-acetylglucosamine malate deacetylase 2
MRGDSTRGSTVFVAAHPDDEVIGAGGLLADTPAPVVLHITDGAPRDMLDARTLGYATRDAYASVRRQEARQALSLAGMRPQQVVSWEIVDQEASLLLAPLARRLCKFLEGLAPKRIFTHPYEGGHPDHDATAFIVHAACALLARRRRTAAPMICEFTSYHGDPSSEKVRLGSFLAPNQAATSASTADGDTRVQLSHGARANKQAMLAAFHSQSRVLSAFRATLDIECFRSAPRYRFTTAPHAGPLYYENFSWGLAPPAWRSLAANALKDLELSPEEAL